jgi:restriction system protein
MGFLDFIREHLFGSGAGTTAIDQVRQLDDEDFVSRLTEGLRREGYSVDRDGMSLSGGDLQLRRRGERTLLRYRYWRRKHVGVGVVRDLYRTAQMEGAAGGKFVTCGEFDQRCREYARGKALELIDGETLLGSMPNLLQAPTEVTLDPALDASFVPHVTVSGELEDFTATLVIPRGQMEAPTCPRCGAAMQFRVAEGGGAQGQKFWACTRMPSCKGIRPV